MIGKNEWLYLPQEVLSSDPLEYNVNAEVFTLTGPAVMQDNEIAAFYRDAQINYGSKNILGILAARSENPEHLILKREATMKTSTEPSTTEAMMTTPANDEPVEDLIYEAKGEFLWGTMWFMDDVKLTVIHSCWFGLILVTCNEIYPKKLQKGVKGRILDSLFSIAWDIV